MTSLVIGLGGRLRSGKDTVADHLVEKHGFHKIGFSDALHEAMLALNPIVVADVTIGEDGPEGEGTRYSELIDAIGYVKAKEQYPEVRRLLQVLGTEVGRNMFDENVWVNITARKIDDSLCADQPVVVTGVRFPNELRMIRQFAGETWWVDRPGLEQSSTHASENGVEPEWFDRVIANDGAFDDLYSKVDGLLAGDSGLSR